MQNFPHHWIFDRSNSLLGRNHWNIVKKRNRSLITCDCFHLTAALKCSHRKGAQLTTANSNDIIIVVVLYLNDLGGQHPSNAPFILWAALPIDEAVFTVGCLHELLALQYGPEEEEGGKISACNPVQWINIEMMLTLLSRSVICHDVTDPIKYSSFINV